jgi:hypothetical protein
MENIRFVVWDCIFALLLGGLSWRVLEEDFL